MSDYVFEVDKEYETRAAEPAIIYAVDRGGDYPIHGAVNTGNRWVPIAWTNQGVASNSYSRYNLMPPKLELWGVQGEYHFEGYETKEEAEREFTSDTEIIHMKQV